MSSETETLSAPEFKRFLLERRPMNAVREVMFRTEKGATMIIKSARASVKGPVTGEVWNGEKHMPLKGEIYCMERGTLKLVRSGFVSVVFERIISVQVNRSLVLERE